MNWAPQKQTLDDTSGTGSAVMTHNEGLQPGTGESTMAKPIAIPSTSPTHSLSTSAGSYLSASRARDGLVMLPSPVAGPSSSSSRLLPPAHMGTPVRPQKRHVSAPMSISASPRSPLAISAESHSHTTRRLSGHFLSPHLSPTSASNSSSRQHRRRRSSAGSLATPYGSFVGSYENSLLTGRMSALPSKPLRFNASLGVMGSGDVPNDLKCPKHLNLPFDAMYYEGQEGGSATSCPYVGTIDLEAHYMDALAQPDMELHRAPRFPGYRIPSNGQVQLVIKNPNSTAIKLFLIPFDLQGLNRDGLGGKTFLQQKCFSVAAEKSEERGKLRFAVHLQFCSPPLSTRSKMPEPQYYLHQTIRVVFASRGLDVEEKLRVVNESPAQDNVIDRFSAYSGPPLEFEILRKKLREREKLRKELEKRQIAAQEAAARDQEVPHDPDLLPESYEPYEAPVQLLSTPPASDLEPMSLSSLGSALPSDATHDDVSSGSSRGRYQQRRPSNLSMSFAGSSVDNHETDEDGTTTPSPFLVFRKQIRRESSTRSALSESRPGSRNE